MKFIRFAVLLIALAVPTSQSQAQELVVNGGFETGTFSSWGLAGNCSLDGGTGIGGGIGAHSGFFYVYGGAVGSPCTISQSIATTIGSQYAFSFWLYNGLPTDGIVGPNSFQALFGAQSLLSLTNATAFAYTKQTFNVTATATNTTVSFIVRNDPDYYRLDDVSVTQVSTVPEPSTLLLSTSGLAIVGLALRRRKR